MQNVGLQVITQSICDDDKSQATYAMRTMEHDVVHSQIHLVEESGVKEVAPLRLVVQQPPLDEECFKRRSGKGSIRN